MTRASVKLTSVAVTIVGLLLAAACASHGGFLGLPGAGSGQRALRTKAAPTSIALIPNTGDKFGFHVRISIAGTPARSFLFDTGSGGLWVYANTIAHTKKTVRDLHIEVHNTYGSGLHYDGEAVEATVSFGNGLSVQNLPLVRVDKAYCVNSHCKALYGTGDITRKLEKERGLWGTLGADLQPKPIFKGAHKSDLYNALFALGTAWTRFAVTPTELEASPSMKGFTTMALTRGPPTNGLLPNGAESWDRDVPVCYTIADSSRTYSGCVSTLFDTGAEFGVTFETKAAAKLPTQETAHCGRILKSGVAFSARTSQGKLLTKFKTGSRQNWNELKVATPMPSATPQVNTGITFYNRNEIIFDAARGRVGLRPLDSPVHHFENRCE